MHCDYLITYEFYLIQIIKGVVILVKNHYICMCEKILVAGFFY